MQIDQPLTLLGGLTPQKFMHRYWQRRPLLIRQAIPGFKPSLSIKDIKELVKREEVESKLIWREEGQWNMKNGPFKRLLAAKQPDWTLLAQSVDLHDDHIATLMHRFRFIADARLDDAMVSIATDGGGVGPHFDSYDVFLLQAHGQRRWRISQQNDLSLEPGLPLKILKNFKAEEEFLLEPGDMLYLPPHVAHDGVAVGDCMTISIGFRAPNLATLAQGMLAAAADQIQANNGDESGLYASPAIPGPSLSERYTDQGIAATPAPAQIPDLLVDAATRTARNIEFNRALATRFLGQWLSDVSANAYFAPTGEHLDLCQALPGHGILKLDRCTRLLYRGDQLFINGEVAPVAASPALRTLANERELDCASPGVRRLGPDELNVLTEWLHDGFLHHVTPD
jgi:50S ribosomal protein L16 3-hydroxylase